MDSKVRILHVFGRTDMGGAETMIMNIYRNIDRNKVQFDFINHTDEKCFYDKEIERLGGRIYHMPRFNGMNYYAYRKAWKNFFTSHSEYQVIHAHMSSTAAIFLKIAKKSGLRTVAHSHNTLTGKDFIAKIKKIFEFNLKNIADYCMACSRAAAKSKFGNREDVIILKNTINVDRYRYKVETRAHIREKLGLDNNFVVMNIARFHLQKNHDFLIDIFNEVYKKNNEARLVLVGDGKLRGEIAKKVEAMGLSDVIHFLGVRSDVPELLMAADVFVLPSLSEGFGISALEAQTTGCPCIVSDMVPKEIKVTDILSFKSLDKSAEDWAKDILKQDHVKTREKYAECVSVAGYDVKVAATWLQDFYLCISK